MMNSFSLWEFLSQDIAFLGGPSSPMLSWLGVFGMLFFFLWHVRTLQQEVTSVRRGFERVSPKLIALAQERGDVDRDRFTHGSGKSARSQARSGFNQSMRSDCDDLQVLDEELNKEPLFREAWARYRTTLILEHVPWFMEPRVFSTKRAEDVLTQEVLMCNRINFSFYQQFPALMTSLGLLLTFLALFVGLGKLHAEGSEIVGIQGLINGLAGKFLTSIVGLMVANAFTFIERPMVSRLMQAHHTFLGLIDQLFPRKSMEQMLEQLTSLETHSQSDQAIAVESRPMIGGEWGMAGLAGPIASLTSSIQSLTKMQEAAHEETQSRTKNVPGTMRNDLQDSLDELTETIHALTKVLKETPSRPPSLEPIANQRPLLWKAPTDVPVLSDDHSSQKPQSWPRWPRLSRSRRAG